MFFYGVKKHAQKYEQASIFRSLKWSQEETEIM